MTTVSVVIPAYNVTPYIAETLDSVFAQTRKDFEVIVVNDCCPDTLNLERALQPYLSRIRYIKQEKNQGVAAARNAGIQAAVSPYVALLDADDIWEPKYLEINLGMLQQDPALDVVWGDIIIFGPVPDAGQRSMDLLPSSGEVNFASLISLKCNVFCNATVKREILLRVGGFDIGQRRVEDFDLWLRIAKAGGKFRYHREVILRYRKRAVSQSSDGSVSLRAMIEYYDKVKREFELTPEELNLTNLQQQEFRAQLDVTEGKKALEEGQVQEAIKRLSSAQRHYRSRKLAWVVRSIHVAPGLVRWAMRANQPRFDTPSTPS